MVKKKTRVIFSMTMAAMLAVTGCSSGGNTAGNTNGTAETKAGAVQTSAEEKAETEQSTGNTSDGAGSGDTIKIGALYGVTGPNAAMSQESIGILNAALDVINNEHPELGDFPFAATAGLPNLGGAKLELVVADTQSSPEIGATEAERLITSEGVSILTGGHLSGISKTISLSAEKHSVPYVAGTAVSPPLTERGLQYFFRPTPTDITYSANAFDFLDFYREKYDLNKVAICVSEDEYGQNNKDLWEQNAKERGYDIVESFAFTVPAVSVTSETIKLKSAAPDVILMAAQASEAIQFTNTFKQMDVRPKVWITARGGFIAPEFFSACGSDINYISTANAWCIDLNGAKPFTAEIDKICEQYAGVGMNGDYAREFQAMMIIADAINRAGSGDPTAIRDALRETDMGPEWLVMPWPGIKFDEKGQNIYGEGIITQIQNEEYVTVFPEEFKTAEPVIPIPAWE